jgi:hypothetical protein
MVIVGMLCGSRLNRDYPSIFRRHTITLGSGSAQSQDASIQKPLRTLESILPALTRLAE